MVKSARKSETETFGIVKRFHRFEDLEGKLVYVIIAYSTYRKNKKQNKTNKQKQKQKTCIWVKQAKGDRIDSKQTRTSLTNEISIDRNNVNEY